ncbi:hypothetical protein EON65_29230 [archaeon]|nr:MAG: hypothetical protein EON65_29230 [archaeon]
MKQPFRHDLCAPPFLLPPPEVRSKSLDSKTRHSWLVVRKNSHYICLFSRSMATSFMILALLVCFMLASSNGMRLQRGNMVMKTIAVFGGTGLTGRECVYQVN